MDCGVRGEVRVHHGARLYGREGEFAELSRLLHLPEVRLLTVTGPAGVGKSALATAVLATIVPSAADAVVGVDLASTGDPLAAWSKVASGLGMSGAAVPTPDRIGAWIGDRRVFLALDNGDLVAPLLAPGIGALLGRCPRLRVLLTSRSSLNVYAEHLFPVAPLPVRPRGRGTGISVAARLFLDRVGAHYRRDVLQGGDLRNISEICEALDGLPLAIEVTARAVGTMGTAELLQALRSGEFPYRSQLLDVPTRHQSVPGALSWGDRALTPDERSLMRRLAVCESSVDLLTVQCLGGLSRMQAAGRLDSLVHKSLLVSAKRAGGEPEFRMLAVVRSHYRKQLARCPEESAEARARHMDHYIRFAAVAKSGLRAADRRSRWLDLVLTRLPDIRTAVHGLQARGAHAEVLRLLLALDDALTVHHLLPEAAVVLERSLAALRAAGPRDDGLTPLLADAFRTAGRWAMVAGDRERASELLTRAGELYERAGVPGGSAKAAVFLGELARRAGDLRGAVALAEGAVATLDARREVRGAAAARRLLALALAGLGDAGAEEPLLRALDDLCSLDDPYARALALVDLARVRLLRGRCAAAHGAVREAMELLLLHSGGPADVVLALETTARAAPDRSDAERQLVRQVLGAARALRERHGVPPGGDPVPVSEGEPPAGCLSLEAALTLALSVPSAPEVADEPGADAVRPAGLTPRQYQIAELVAEGMTNRQIARTLELSEWTVVNHLRQVMNKLECPSRVHVARVMRQRAG